MSTTVPNSTETKTNEAYTSPMKACTNHQHVIQMAWKHVLSQFLLSTSMHANRRQGIQHSLPEVQRMLYSQMSVIPAHLQYSMVCRDGIDAGIGCSLECLCIKPTQFRDIRPSPELLVLTETHCNSQGLARLYMMGVAVLGHVEVWKQELLCST